MDSLCDYSIIFIHSKYGLKYQTEKNYVMTENRVQITNAVTIAENQSMAWARESTLLRLAESSEDTLGVLKKWAQSRGVDLSNIKKLTSTSGETTTSMGKLNTETQGASRSMHSYNRAVDELTRNTHQLRSGLNSIIGGTADPMRSLPGLFTNLGASIGGLVGSRGPLRLLGTVATLTGAAVGALVARYMDAGDAYRSMMSTGILFEGSINSMISSVRSSGVSLQQASQIIQNRSQALIVQGEGRFFSTVGRMGETFARFGMTMDQGAETLAELMDQQRITGTLFSMSQDDIIRANTTQLNQMQSISRLTGVSIRQQMEERRRVSERQSMRAMAAQLEGPDLARFEALRNALTAAAVPEDAAAGILLQEFGKGTTTAGALGQQALGPQGMEIIRQAMETGDASLIQRNAAVFEQASRDMLTRLPAILGERGGRGAEQQAIALSILERSRVAALGPTAAARQAQADRAAAGESLITPGTEGFFRTVNATAMVMGNLEATVMNMTGPAMEYLWEQTGRAASAMFELLTVLENQGPLAAARLAGQQAWQFLGENPAMALGVGGAAAATYAASRALGARAGATPTTPDAPGGGTARPGALSRAGSFLRRGGSQVLGFEQLFSAGQAAYEGNFTEAAGHAGLFLLRRNPLAMAASALDFLMEETTGRGLVERGSDMLTGPGATTPAETPLSSPLVQEQQIAETRTITDIIEAFNTGFMTLATRLDLMTASLAPNSPIINELTLIAQNTRNTATILENRM